MYINQHYTDSKLEEFFLTNSAISVAGNTLINLRKIFTNQISIPKTPVKSNGIELTTTTP